jgi:predicted dithiol-disulfide oxidoreductase (DUF899 family)
MKKHDIVSQSEWVRARKTLLEKEKELTRAGDALAEARRELPWVRVEKPYVFDTTDGEKTLADLFAGRSQLIVYHFMFAPDWEVGCKSCSFWADNFNGIVSHVAQRDATLIAVSRAPLAKLLAFRKRLGWSFNWVSSNRSDFNFDYQVSFEEGRGDGTYNFVPRTSGSSELPGISVFYRDESGAIFHTYSSYGRGVETVNAAYRFLDLLPRGRDEANRPQAWLKFHDQYDASA